MEEETREGRTGEEREGQESRFEQTQSRIDEIGSKDPARLSIEERAERTQLVRERSRLGETAKAANAFSHADAVLVGILREALSNPNPIGFLSEKMERGEPEKIERTTHALMPQNIRRRLPRGEYGGIISFYTSRALTRMYLNFMERDGGVSEEQLREWRDNLEPLEDWEWQVPPPEPAAPPPPPGAERGAGARTEGPPPGPEPFYTSRYSAPPDFGRWTPEQQFNWLREKLADLEGFNKIFKETDPGRLQDAVERANESVRKSLKEEYEAREFLQTFNVVLTSANGFEEFSKAVSGLLDPRYLNTLFRIQINGEYVVAKAFRAYEAHAEGPESLDWAINKLKDRKWIEDHSKDRDKDPGTEKARIEALIASESEAPAWAVEAGRRLWILLERAAQYNVYTEGANFTLARLDNLKEAYLEPEREPGKKFPSLEGLWKSWDLGYQNLTSRIVEGMAQNALRAEQGPDWDKDKSSAQKNRMVIEKLRQMSIVAKERHGNIAAASLADAPLETIDFTWYMEKGFYGGTHLYKAAMADVTRKILMDPGGFFEAPGWRNFEKLQLEGFKHLSAAEKRKTTYFLLRDMLQFNRDQRSRRLKMPNWNTNDLDLFLDLAARRGAIDGNRANRLKKELFGIGVPFLGPVPLSFPGAHILFKIRSFMIGYARGVAGQKSNI